MRRHESKTEKEVEILCNEPSPTSHLRTEANPVSETLFFVFSRILDDGQSTKTN
jgi:hypothetical protein